MDMEIVFPGGKKVNALYNGFVIQTDQSEKAGGEGTAPSPFTLFLASLGTCAGYFVMNFCQKREIPTDNLQMTMKLQQNPETKMIEK